MSIDRILAALPGMAAGQREQVRCNARRWCDTGTPQQQSEGRRVLAALEAQLKAERPALHVYRDDLDLTGQVIEAFRAVRMTETECKLIQVLLDHHSSRSGKWHQDQHANRQCADPGPATPGHP